MFADGRAIIKGTSDTDRARTLYAKYIGRDLLVDGIVQSAKNGEPVEVTVSVVKVNPRAEVVFYGSVTLARKGDEATAARFTVLPDGAVTDVNTLPKTLVQRL